MENGGWGGWNKISAGAADSFNGNPNISGNLGIGISPTTELHIKSTYDNENSGICLDASDGSTYQLKILPYVVGSGKIGHKFRTYNNENATAYDGLRLTFNGYVGIGVNNAPYYFEIADSGIGPTALSSSVYYSVYNGTPIGISTTGSTSFSNISAYIRGTLAVGHWIASVCDERIKDIKYTTKNL